MKDVPLEELQWLRGTISSGREELGWAFGRGKIEEDWYKRHYDHYTFWLELVEIEIEGRKKDE